MFFQTRGWNMKNQEDRHASVPSKRIPNSYLKVNDKVSLSFTVDTQIFIRSQYLGLGKCQILGGNISQIPEKYLFRG